MKPKLIQKIEKEQFDLEQAAMEAGMSALHIPKENSGPVLQYFRWLCFDRLLLAEHNTERLRQQNQRHRAWYEDALQKALAESKPQLADWDRAGRAMLEVYRNSCQSR